MYVCTQGRYVIFLVYANKDTTYTHNVAALPPCGWVGGVLPSAAMYRYNYMFVLIYVFMAVCLSVSLFVCMYVRVHARSVCHFSCVCKQRYYIYT